MDEEALRRLIEEVLDEDDEDGFVDGACSDTNESDHCEESDHDSNSEESGVSEDEDLDVSQVFICKDGCTKWRKTAANRRVKARKRNIITHLPGVKGQAKNCKSPIDCFSILIDTTIISTITVSTNIKIEKDKEKNKNDRTAYMTDDAEIKAVIGLLILAGSIRSGHRNLPDLWNLQRIGIQVFPTTINLKRFQFLLRYIRFDDINTRQQRRQDDKLAPVRFIFDHFIRNCRANYIPSEYLTVDEQLTPFRGRCSFRQYLPSKPAKYGLKILTLTDAKTWYTISMEVYVGNQPDGPYKVSNSAADLVMRLTEPVNGTGRNITGDNWFSSIPLVQRLLEKNLTYVGTLRKNKREIPTQFVAKKREVKSTLFGFQNDFTLVSYTPKKNTNVILISSMHLEDDTIDLSTGEDKKPSIITFYNDTKGGVDVVDKLCATYSTARKCNRWPLVIFFRIIDIAGINSHAIFKGNNPEKKMVRKDFLWEIGFGLVQDQLKKRATLDRLPREIRLQATRLSGSTSTNGDQQAREGGRGVGGGGGGRGEPATKRRCIICPRNKDVKTRSVCHHCGKYMCLKHLRTVCEQCLNGNESAEEDY